MGMADTNGTANTYVENCTFNNMFLQATDFDDISGVVIRHCNVPCQVVWPAIHQVGQGYSSANVGIPM
jgi:hypothetical protein